MSAHVQTFDLEIKQLFISYLIDLDQELSNVDVKITIDRRVEYMANQVTAMLRVPTKVLQDRKILATYPDGLWQHIRKSVGLKYRLIEVRLSEWLVFPQYKVPPGMDRCRVAVMPTLTLNDWRKDA